MPDFHSRMAASWMRCASAAAALGLSLPAPAIAQYIGTAPPPPLPAAPRAGEVETPAAALARAVRTLARSPRDFAALVRAGRAALDLGDTQAAIGFFGRAEEVRPSDPAPKIGMGAATVANGDAGGALRWFYQAQQLGATSAAIGADRGLAQDLLGNQAAAQVDYRAALTGPQADEARRRLALSLGISGNRTGAFTVLQPLLNRRDPASQRIRAFVLALVGDERGASSAIDTAMPGTGGRMAGFFRLLPALSAPQKAAAVHLGVFPDPREIRVAAVSPRLATAPLASNRAPARQSSPAQRAVPAPKQTPPIAALPRLPAVTNSNRAALPVFKVGRVAVAFPLPQQVAPTAATPAVTAPAVTAPAVTAPATPVATFPVSTAPVSTAPAAAAPQSGFSPPAIPSASQASPDPPKLDLPSERATPAAVAQTAPVETVLITIPTDRLSGIDRLLAQADDLPVPPAPRPRFEKILKNASSETASTKKIADAKNATDAKKAAEPKKAADAKKAAEAKKLADAKKMAEAKKAAEEKEAREAIGLAGTNWVQLAGGAHADRMATEFRRLSAKSSALRKKGAAVTAGKDYFRLLTGPFSSKSEAQSFVNQLAKDGVDGFSWLRTPATIKIEKLQPK